jgi:hypothetical protein
MSRNDGLIAGRFPTGARFCYVPVMPERLNSFRSAFAMGARPRKFFSLKRAEPYETSAEPFASERRATSWKRIDSASLGGAE